MGQVVPFIARVRDSGDWTMAERARLQEVADRLAASGVHVEVIFGATDEGDPWCVVTDGDGDVLIHVARIDGRFVVHSAVDDAINEDVDLHTALRDQLDMTAAALSPQSATILPFGLTARQGQTFLALIAATAFFYETAAGGGEAQASEAPPKLPTDPTPPPPEVDAPTQDREVATQAAALQPSVEPDAPVVVVQTPPAEAAASTAAPAEEEPDDLPPPVVGDLETPAAAPDTSAARAASELPVVIQGTDGDDLLVGTAADEHLIGGAGADTLSGGGGHDLLDGGAGDDRIELAADSVAIGGEGADTFVIQAPTQFGHADTLLGTILDFSSLDRLVLASGRRIQLQNRPLTEADKTAPTEAGLTGQGFGGQDWTLGPQHPAGDDRLAPTSWGPPLTRVEIDLDGDGVADGFLLMGPGGHMFGGDESPIVITGQALPGSDPFG